MLRHPVVVMGFFMYALVEFKGKQYRAEKGSLLKVDRIDAEPGTALEIDTVLLLSGGEGQVTVGTPYVEGAKVSARLESHGKDKKIIVFKYKPKKDYRRKQGHRQQFSLVKVEDIAGA
jgi:large subunit ribosomal protein L21